MSEAPKVIAQAISDALDAKIRAARRRSQPVEARVVGTDAEGTTWVALPDGSHFPIAVESAGWNTGDLMTVEERGGMAYITGNISDPPTPGSDVRMAQGEAENARKEALSAAAGAEDASQSALLAAEAASLAQDMADAASSSANSAHGSADTALYQLSVVEDVVGTVEWLAAHAVYSRTEDEGVVPGKAYYALSGGSYVLQDVPEYTYSATVDSSPEEGKPYFALSGGLYSEVDVSGGFAQGTVYYERSESSPHALGLYEARAGETVQNYIASHLALLDDGLYLSTDEGGFRLRLSASGWEVLDVDGQPVTATIADAQGHVTATLGRLDGLHLSITESRLAFSYPNGAEFAEVAWIEVDPVTGASSFRIGNVVVMSELRIGSWKWYEDAGGRLTLKWTGE